MYKGGDHEHGADGASDAGVEQEVPRRRPARQAVLHQLRRAQAGACGPGPHAVGSGGGGPVEVWDPCQRTKGTRAELVGGAGADDDEPMRPSQSADLAASTRRQAAATLNAGQAATAARKAATSAWPVATARAWAVVPLLVLAATSAPEEASSCATSRCPLYDAT